MDRYVYRPVGAYSSDAHQLRLAPGERLVTIWERAGYGERRPYTYVELRVPFRSRISTRRPGVR